MYNASATLSGINLFLDIDSRDDKIKTFFFEGDNASHYQLELEEVKAKSLDKPLSEIKKIKRADILAEVRMTSGEKAVAPMGLTLLQKAINNYEGETERKGQSNDMVCLCFSVSKKDIVKKVLANKTFELKTLIQETMASSACGSCRKLIEKIIDETRLSNGLIKGFDHAKTRFDQNGEWLKVGGLYPGELLLKIEDLKNTWMNREGILDQFQFEFVSIEGLHVGVKITALKGSLDEKKSAALLNALSDYLKSSLGFLLFLQALV